MKKLLALAIVALIGAVAIQTKAFADDDKPITTDQLPAAAQQTVKQQFGAKKVALAKMESGIIDKSYDVIFATGERIEFDRKGNWTEVDCKTTAVPQYFIPSQIASYVKTNYPDAKVVKIEKDDGNYDVKLSNQVELTFNKKFRVTDIDID